MSADTNLDKLEIRNNKEAHQYEAEVDGDLAFISYEETANGIILIHTEVPEALEGHGIAAKLAQTALDDARVRGLAVIPLCPYVASYIRRHPDYADLVPAEYQAHIRQG